MRNPAANWAIAKRMLHWALALSVLTALLAPKPGDGEGLLHIGAGTAALALALMRVIWRSAASVGPRSRDSLRHAQFGTQAALSQANTRAACRLGGFLFLAAIPIAVGGE